MKITGDTARTGSTAKLYKLVCCVPSHKPHRGDVWWQIVFEGVKKRSLTLSEYWRRVGKNEDVFLFNSDKATWKMNPTSFARHESQVRVGRILSPKTWNNERSWNRKAELRIYSCIKLWWWPVSLDQGINLLSTDNREINERMRSRQSINICAEVISLSSYKRVMHCTCLFSIILLHKQTILVIFMSSWQSNWDETSRTRAK